MSKADNSQAWLNQMKRGAHCFQRGDLAAALDAFARATGLQPARAEGWINLGSVLLQAGRHRDAAEALRRAAAINPQLAIVHMLLGDAQRMLGQRERSLASYRKAVALERSSSALNKLACALRTVHEPDAARDLYLEVLEKNPQFTLARVNLATLHLEVGDYEQAEQHLQQLAAATLPPPEQKEVQAAQQALGEYRRLQPHIDTMAAGGQRDGLEQALRALPRGLRQVDDAALQSIRRYVASAQKLKDWPAAGAVTLPREWPLIEALFMIPLINSHREYATLAETLQSTRDDNPEIHESLNMQGAINAARDARDLLADPVMAEVQLRHWHAVASAGVPGLAAGHFKYTQNVSASSPTQKRVEPHQASATLQRFLADLYPQTPAGLPRAAVLLMAVCDLHCFADGNGRVALLWMNRELEWQGLMPTLFSRELGFKGQLGRAMQAVRDNGGELSPLLEVLQRAQTFSLQFCSELDTSRPA